MFKPKRINLTLNARQISDAQIIAALDSLGGESASVLKTLALRGIMSDPSLFATLTQGIALMNSARNADGCGFKSMSPSTTTSDTEANQMPGDLKQSAPSAIQPILPPPSQTSVSVLNATKPAIDVCRAAPASFTDFLRG